MVSFNKTIQLGNITRDPELRYTQNGVAVCDFGIAINRVRSRQEDAVDFFNVTAWRELGETIANYKKKGDPILVEGRLEYSSWETEEGAKRSAVKIVAEGVQFLPGTNGGSGQAQGSRGTKDQAGAPGGSQAEPAATDEDDFDDIPF